MRPVYLHDWAQSQYFGMVAGFCGSYMTEADYESKSAPHCNGEYWLEEKEKMRAALADEKFSAAEILLAAYQYEAYSGEAFVLFRRDGKLYEVNGGHCSCYGLEGQWEPEETTLAALTHRAQKGDLGGSEYGMKFSDELALVLAELAKAAP